MVLSPVAGGGFAEVLLTVGNRGFDGAKTQVVVVSTRARGLVRVYPVEGEPWAAGFGHEVIPDFKARDVLRAIGEVDGLGHGGALVDVDGVGDHFRRGSARLFKETRAGAQHERGVALPMLHALRLPQSIASHGFLRVATVKNQHGAITCRVDQFGLAELGWNGAGDAARGMLQELNPVTHGQASLLKSKQGRPPMGCPASRRRGATGAGSGAACGPVARS